MIDKEIFNTDLLMWNSRYFGMYTFFMTFTGFFVGNGGWFILVSLITFTLSLWAYAKNKEVLELQKEISNKLKNVRK